LKYGLLSKIGSEVIAVDFNIWMCTHWNFF